MLDRPTEFATLIRRTEAVVAAEPCCPLLSQAGGAASIVASRPEGGYRAQR